MTVFILFQPCSSTPAASNTVLPWCWQYHTQSVWLSCLWAAKLLVTQAWSDPHFSLCDAVVAKVLGAQCFVPAF
jgi:hypothetical protein